MYYTVLTAGIPCAGILKKFMLEVPLRRYLPYNRALFEHAIGKAIEKSLQSKKSIKPNVLVHTAMCPSRK
jgi:hypothetical protein